MAKAKRKNGSKKGVSKKKMRKVMGSCDPSFGTDPNQGGTNYDGCGSGVAGKPPGPLNKEWGFL